MARVWDGCWRGVWDTVLAFMILTMMIKIGKVILLIRLTEDPISPISVPEKDINL